MFAKSLILYFCISVDLQTIIGHHECYYYYYNCWISHNHELLQNYSEGGGRLSRGTNRSWAAYYYIDNAIVAKRYNNKINYWISFDCPSHIRIVAGRWCTPIGSGPSSDPEVMETASGTVSTTTTTTEEALTTTTTLPPRSLEISVATRPHPADGTWLYSQNSGARHTWQTDNTTWVYRYHGRGHIIFYNNIVYK